MRRRLYGLWAVPVAVLWFASNGGLISGMPPCPAHGSLMVMGDAPAGMAHRHHSGSHKPARDGGCDCGGRCGTPTHHFVVVPSVSDLEAAPPVRPSPPAEMATRVVSAKQTTLPPATGPPSYLDA